MATNLESYFRYFLKQENIDEINKDTVQWFLDECAAEGLSEARQVKYIFGFLTLLKKFTPPNFILNDGTEEQLKKIVAAVHRSDYSNSTKCFFKQCLKKFYRLKNGGLFPDKVRFIKTTRKKTTPVRKEDLYTPGEIRRIISQLRNPRDKAFIMVQYESGARTGEMLNATLADVTLDENGEFIRLYGLKNTPDQVNQLVEAGYFLKEWLYTHPSGGDPYKVKDPSAPLWVKIEQHKCKHCGKNCIDHKTGSCQRYEPAINERMTLSNIHRNFERACQKAVSLRGVTECTI